MNIPALYNVTIHQLNNFQYLDQGVVKLSRKTGLIYLEMKLSVLGDFATYVGLTKLGFCNANALCAFSIQSHSQELYQFEAVASTLENERCLSGLTRLQTENIKGKKIIKSGFIVGYALE